MTFLTALSLAAWVYLVVWHGRFWQAGPSLGPVYPQTYPAVAVVVPARDEAPSIAACVTSLLAQDYEGDLHVVVVDDGSTDGTGDIVRKLASDGRLTPVNGGPRPAGWSGKLWAIEQGLTQARIDHEPVYYLLTDADIIHDPRHVATLVAKAERDGLDLVSEMVALNCQSLAERALVPAFVYFFQLLFPFAWVNDAMRGTAAAAGGTVLVRARALTRLDGMSAIRGALIDDIALAVAVKRGGRIWLGHSRLARSIRPYPRPIDLWRMVARTAYVQLRLSPAMLLLTVFGLGVLFLVPPAATLFGHLAARWLGLAAWLLMAASYLRTLRRFRLTPAWAPALPAIATFFMAATVGSAIDHHFGGGVVWKNRVYGEAR